MSERGQHPGGDLAGLQRGQQQQFQRSVQPARGEFVAGIRAHTDFEQRVDDGKSQATDLRRQTPQRIRIEAQPNPQRHCRKAPDQTPL